MSQDKAMVWKASITKLTKKSQTKKNQIFMHNDLACPCQIYDLIACIDLLCFSIPFV